MVLKPHGGQGSEAHPPPGLCLGHPHSTGRTVADARYHFISALLGHGKQWERPRHAGASPRARAIFPRASQTSSKSSSPRRARSWSLTTKPPSEGRSDTRPP